MKRYKPKDCEVIVAYGDSKKRELAMLFADKGFSFANAIHLLASLSPSARLGNGSIINPGAIVLANAQLGNHIILHATTVVEHDNFIGDYANLAPGVTLAGRVRVGTGSILYTGVKVIPAVVISDWVTVAAGSLVTKNISEGSCNLNYESENPFLRSAARVHVQPGRYHERNRGGVLHRTISSGSCY